MAEAKRKNKRLKSYNYTEKRENLKKEVKKAIANKDLKSKNAIAKKAGYITPSSKTTAPIADMIEEIYPLHTQLREHVEIAQNGDEQGQVKLKAQEMLYKLRDVFPATKNKNETMLTVLPIEDVVKKLDEQD